MIRVLQLSARNLVVPSTLSGLRGVTAASAPTRPPALGLKQQRLISVSSIYFKQQGSSSSSSSSSKDHRGEGKKKSLMDVASEKLESVGMKTRSKTKATGPDHASSTTKHDSRQGDHSHVEKSSSKDHRSAGHSSQTGAAKSSGSGSSGHSAPSNKINHKPKSNESSGPKSAGPSHTRGPVRQDKKAKKFLLDLDNNQVAYIQYHEAGNGRIEFYHTEVPKELRGKGIGKALAKGAFESALKSNLKLKVTCSYLQDYLKRFAGDKFKKLLD